MELSYTIFYIILTYSIKNWVAASNATDSTPYAETIQPSNSTNDEVLPYDGNVIGSYNENDVILDHLMEVNNNISKSSNLTMNNVTSTNTSTPMNNTNTSIPINNITTPTNNNISTSINNKTTPIKNNISAFINNGSKSPEVLTKSNQTLNANGETRNSIRKFLHRSLDNLMHKQNSSKPESELTGRKLRDIPHPVVIANTTVILSSNNNRSRKNNTKHQLVANLLKKLISKPVKIPTKNITVKKNESSEGLTAKLINTTITNVYNTLNKLLSKKNISKTFHVDKISTKVKQIDAKKISKKNKKSVISKNSHENVKAKKGNVKKEDVAAKKGTVKKEDVKVEKENIKKENVEVEEEENDEFGPLPLKMIELEKRVQQALDMNLYTFFAPLSILGLTGKPGNYGKQGAQGFQGQQGPPGHPGATGSMGNTGRQGPFGDQGPAGNPGEPGPPGNKGPPGDIGVDGDEGKSGNTGPMGAVGEPGYSTDQYILPNCSYICGNEKYWLECKKFEVLNIITAFWGREGETICPNAPIGLTTHKKCGMEGDAAWKKLSDQCNDKNACEIISTNLFFDDNDNDDVYKYTKVCYECTIDESQIVANMDKKRRSIKI